MNKYILLMLLVFGLNSSISLAATTGSAFSYQGELTDNGSPANGDYDITVSLFSNFTGGSSIIDESFPDTPVVNGLFNLIVDFGDMVYEDHGVLYFEIEITPSTGGTPTILAPRNQLLAVPYAVQAEFLAPGTATNGDLLTFDGSNWVPAPSNSSSPWNVSGTTLTTLGNVGIGTSAPSDRLHIRSSAGEDPLRVQIANSTKLRVHQNGGTSLGINNPPNTPDNGLYVSGDVKQNQNSNGMLKYMVIAQCDAFPTIEREYNGTNVTGSAAIVNNSLGNCDIELPFDTANSFVVVSPMNPINLVNRTANCIAAATFIRCKFEESSTGTNVNDAFFTLLVY